MPDESSPTRKKGFLSPDDGSVPRGGWHELLVLATGRVALQLGLAFGLLVALLITAGDLGMRRMDRTNAELEDILGRQWTKLRLAREGMAISNRNSRITMEVFLLRDRAQVEALLASRAKNSGQISALISDLERVCKSEAEVQRLDRIKETRKQYLAAYQQALHLLADGRREPAATIMVEQATPALFRYHDAWDNFSRYEGEQLDIAARESRAHYAAARLFALILMAAAVLVSGVIVLFVVRRVVRDTTSRLRSQREELQTAHQEAEVFINAVPSILIGVDSELRITRWNLTAANVFGLPLADVADKTLFACGIKWLRPNMQEVFQTWFSGDISRRCDQIPFDLNGETRMLGLTMTRVHMLDENRTKLLVIGSDTTQRNNLEAQLRQAQKLESVGQLAAGIAHEINTPTQYIGDNVRFLKDAFQDINAVVLNYDKLLTAGRDSPLSQEKIKEMSAALESAGYLLEEIPKAIDQTLEGVARVSNLVHAMKEFSHPGTKEKILLDLNHAIQSTITVARNEWKYVAEMETEFDPSLPLIPVQPGEFNQVILNLIVNAAHAIADVVGKGGSAMGKIKIRTQNCGKWAEIRIEDTGAGIPEAVRARIFDPFFTTKEVGKGTGQGLAIAHSVVVDKHDGTIHFETEVGKGTTFIIRLPREGKSLTAKAVSA